MKTFTPSLTKRKAVLKRIRENEPSWKPRMAAAFILAVITLGVLLGSGWLLWKYPMSEEGIVLMIGAALCVACVPFLSCISVIKTAKYRCGLPYSSYANGSLILKDDSLEYLFWQAGPNEPAAYSSKRAVFNDEYVFIYRIKKEDVRAITIHDDICTVTGKGMIETPEWTEENGMTVEDCGTFSFIVAFEQENTEYEITEWRK